MDDIAVLALVGPIAAAFAAAECILMKWHASKSMCCAVVTANALVRHSASKFNISTCMYAW